MQLVLSHPALKCQSTSSAAEGSLHIIDTRHQTCVTFDVHDIRHGKHGCQGQCSLQRAPPADLARRSASSLEASTDATSPSLPRSLSRSSAASTCACPAACALSSASPCTINAFRLALTTCKSALHRCSVSGKDHRRHPRGTALHVDVYIRWHGSMRAPSAQ